MWLVNYDNTLEDTYRPAKLEYLSGFPIRPEAGAAFNRMREDMQKAGIKNLRLQSAYRPYGYQYALFEHKLKYWQNLGHEESVAQVLAARSVAKAGASEHQTGLAVDVSLNGKLSVHFGSTEAGIWLQNNCSRYGFIVRYPPEKTAITRIMYEPWHLRYVGVPHAQYMYDHNMCLEEYVEHVKNSEILLYWVDEKVYYKVSFILQPDEDSEAAYDISSVRPGGAGGYIVTELKNFVR